jgi:hypothetical protein
LKTGESKSPHHAEDGFSEKNQEFDLGLQISRLDTDHIYYTEFSGTAALTLDQEGGPAPGISSPNNLQNKPPKDDDLWRRHAGRYHPPPGESTIARIQGPPCAVYTESVY